MWTAHVPPLSVLSILELLFSEKSTRTPTPQSDYPHELCPRLARCCLTLLEYKQNFREMNLSLCSDS